MNSTKIIFGVALIACCYISLSYTIKCYVCDSKKSCKSPKLLECNSKLANDTREYIYSFHKNASLNATSPFYECFHEYIETPTSKYYYKGCTYASIEGCKLVLDEHITSTKFKEECYQCNDKQGCNPADYNKIDFRTLFAAIIVGLVAHLGCYSLRCFVCNSKDSCKKAQLYECDTNLANNTRGYLQLYHTGVNPNTTSHTYECFQEYIHTTSNAEYYYRSCIYSNIQGCRLPLSYTVGSTKKHDCRQCYGDGCNPAGRANIDTMTVFVTIIVAATMRYVWH